MELYGKARMARGGEERLGGSRFNLHVNMGLHQASKVESERIDRWDQGMQKLWPP